jgi:hypothetical protein
MKEQVNISTADPDKNRYQIISYYTLRKLIGSAGIFLPSLMVIGKWVNESSLQLEYSISDYYNNGLAGDILVGVLFALGFFLFSYKGPEKVDSRAANIGCIAALGVALCPTTSSVAWIHRLHFGFALLLFGVFIFFSLVLFRKTDPSKRKTREKENRNKAYLVCGIIMTVCIAGIPICIFLLPGLSSQYNLVFWLETAALEAFGFSWITKAEFLWKDSDNLAEKNRV